MRFSRGYRGSVTRLARLLLLAGLLTALVASPPAAPAQVNPPAATPTATGTGGAVATVDPYATKIGLDVLRKGGNAIDAAVAAAAALGVVEPFSCGIGGGGFMVIRRADGKVTTIDGRETAPRSFPENAFIDPRTNQPYPSSMFMEIATSGLSVGVPGTVPSWEMALKLFGTRKLRKLVLPAERLARLGFVVDPTFTKQVADNEARFKDFTTTRALFLPGDRPPAAGTTFRNPDLANTYRRIARRGARALHTGAVARDIVTAVQKPPLVAGSTRNARPGYMTLEDLARYKAERRYPTRSTYRGYEIVGMGPPSSGGSTVAEALNILEGYSPLNTDAALAHHRFLEASKLAFADRGAYLGDPDFVKVPLTGLLDKRFAAERRALISGKAMTAPVAAGNPWPYEPASQGTRPSARASDAQEGPSTTHLTTADRFGNVVSYTFTIESTGGAGIVVPQRGFLLNNELTDFDFALGRPNSPKGGKRPRSSMSPTIVLKDRKPVLALGSPGGSTIITTVLQVLVNRIDFVRSLPDAIADPRASQRNTPSVTAEPAFVGSPVGQTLAGPYGHRFTDGGEIGAVTAIEFLGDGRVQAAAEPIRRGGGSAMTQGD